MLLLRSALLRKEDINTKLSDNIALVFARLQFFVNYPELGLTSISRRP